jgi:hypothetical protein
LGLRDLEKEGAGDPEDATGDDSKKQGKGASAGTEGAKDHEEI